MFAHKDFKFSSHSQSVLSEFKNLKDSEQLNPGVLIRKVSAAQLPQDLIKMKKPDNSFFMPATLISEDIPISLIGENGQNLKWAELSGIIMSASETSAPITCKYDTHSELLLDREYSFFGSSYVVPRTSYGSLDIDKMIKKSKTLSAYGVGGKLKTSIPDLRIKMQEQKQRIDSKQSIYYTTKGREKLNEDKISVMEVGTITQNEVLTLPTLDDIVGVYLNTTNAKSMTEAIELMSLLEKESREIDYFVYEAKKGKLDVVSKNALPPILIDSLPDLRSKINKLVKNNQLSEIFTCLQMHDRFLKELKTGLTLEKINSFDVDVNVKYLSGETPLILAAKQDDAKLTAVLLERGAMINVCDQDEKTVLSYAKNQDVIQILEKSLELITIVKKGDPTDLTLKTKIVELIQAGAVVNARDSKGRTALIYAADNGLTDIVAQLVAYPTCKVEQVDLKDKTALSYAVMNGKKDVFDLLFSQSTIEERNRAWFLAIQNNKKEIVKIFLADEKINGNEVDSNGNAAIFLAATREEIFYLILEKKPDLKVCHPLSKCNIPAHLMKLEETSNSVDNSWVLERNIRVVDAILTAIPDLDVRDALYFALNNKNKKMVELILKKGTNPENLSLINEYYGEEAYHVIQQRNIDGIMGYFSLNNQFKSSVCCSLFKDLKEQEALLERRANPNIVINHNEMLMTFLQLTVIDNDLDQAKLLLKYKANVDSRDELGRTALMLVAQLGRLDFVDLLLEYKADPLLINPNNDRTALMYAAATGQIKICEKIILRSDVFARDKEGETALSLATKYDHPDIVQLIKQRQAELAPAQMISLSNWVCKI